MIFDFENLIMDGAEVLTGAAQTIDSTNSLDLGAVGGREVGTGAQVCVHLRVTTAFTGAGTVTIALVEDADGTLSAGANVLRQTDALAIAELPLGAIIELTVPAEQITLRYLGVRVTTTSTGPTAGNLEGGIVWSAQTAKSDWTAVTGY